MNETAWTDSCPVRAWFTRTLVIATIDSMPAAGDRAPAFDLPDQHDSKIRLSSLQGHKVLVYFYPRADTPGCTREAMEFSKLKAAFAKCGTDVLGISADSVRAQDAFKTKHKLKVDLLSDERHDILEAYGVWGEKSMYGKTFMGIIRTTVLIGPDGTIARIWPKVKVDGHAAAVLAAAKAL